MKYVHNIYEQEMYNVMYDIVTQAVLEVTEATDLLTYLQIVIDYECTIRETADQYCEYVSLRTISDAEEEAIDSLKINCFNTFLSYSRDAESI